MYKRSLLAIVALSIFMVIPAFAEGNNPVIAGCKEKKVVGSYVRTEYYPDIFGNGTNVERTYIFQLNLNEGGTAMQYYTAFPDFHLLGFASPTFGSWICREDGKIVVTAIRGHYGPATFNPGTGMPTQDIQLIRHQRITILFSVFGDDDLKQEKFARRRYSLAEDPADPNAGILDPTSIGGDIWKRVKASDADLTP